MQKSRLGCIDDIQFIQIHPHRDKHRIKGRVDTMRESVLIHFFDLVQRFKNEGITFNAFIHMGQKLGHMGVGVLFLKQHIAQVVF